jgi:VWFA-related protein
VAGQPPPAFRTSVDYVEVDAVATDARGGVVTGLTRDDFTIREDGRAVEIRTFVPVLADRETTDAEGRFVVLLLDNILTPPMLTTNVKAIAHRFADRMGPHDVAGVAMINGSATKTTTSRDAIAAAIDTFRYEASLILPIPVARRHALDMMRGLAQQLTPLRHRRKILVCIGGAAMFGPTEPAGRMMTYSGEWAAALSEASTANLAVYVIDPAGLTDARPDDAMAFADVTGGRVFKTNEFAKAVDRVWDEAGRYYLLGYEAPPGGRRKTHSIDVGVSVPGVTVRARQQR